MRPRKPKAQQHLQTRSAARTPRARARATARSSADDTATESVTFRCSVGMARELVREAKQAGGIRQYLARLMKMSGVRNVPDRDAEESPRYRSFD
jgi:hypothetical protein